MPQCDSAATDQAEDGTEDSANGGIRREPMLPEHEAVAPEASVPTKEFADLEDESDDEAVKARAVRRSMRTVARQAAMDPDDGIAL